MFNDAWDMKDVGGAKVKTTISHASMNDAVVALAGFIGSFGNNGSEVLRLYS